MSAHTIVTQLGGPTAVARRLGIKSQAVSHWSLKGRIPAERVPQLERMARELGAAVRAEDMRADVDWAALRCNCGASRA